jgi:hypothetical protein
VSTCEDKTCDAADYRLVNDEVQAVLERCAGVIAREPAIARCTRNLRDFTPRWLAQHSPDSYGFTVDNHTYLTAQEAEDAPRGMMRPPPALVAALPRRARLETVARENGWKYLTHDSALGGARTFVFIPDPEGRYDQWMLLNFVHGEQPEISPETPMSFIAVQKKGPDGRALPAVRVHFRDYTPVRGEGGYTLELEETSNGKCYACHPSGVRQLIPRRTRILEAAPVKGEPGYDPSGGPAPQGFAYSRLQELNARLRSYGLPDWNGRIVPEHHGPALGAREGCLGCHDGRSRGLLTVSTSLQQIGRKIHDELAMPPEAGLKELLERSERKDPPLSPEEHKRLEEAFVAHARLDRELSASRLPALKRWLLEAPCR